MKEDEKRFLIHLIKYHGIIPYKGNKEKVPFADQLANEIGLNVKRAMYILRKWSDNGYWNSGVSLRSGWITPEGVEYFKKYL